MGWTFDAVFIARHGETEWNREGRRQGQLDSPLTAIGIAQADGTARLAAEMAVDGIFTSPLGRARATATAIAACVGVAAEVVAELAEVHHGEFAGLTHAEIRKRYPGALEERAANKYSWRFPGGESYKDADARVYRALERVHQSGSHRPLLVTHEMLGLMLLRQLLHLAPDAALARSIPSGVIVEVLPSQSAVHERRVE
jgi:probable phosphoglycerate mutase